MRGGKYKLVRGFGITELDAGLGLAVDCAGQRTDAVVCAEFPDLYTVDFKGIQGVSTFIGLDFPIRAGNSSHTLNDGDFLSVLLYRIGTIQVAQSFARIDTVGCASVDTENAALANHMERAGVDRKRIAVTLNRERGLERAI